jgi:hypothetical protein
MALNSYEYAAKNINEIGNLIGGWIKQQSCISGMKGDKS